MTSFNATIDQYRLMLTKEGVDRLTLPNDNIDTGALTAAGKYQGADFAYDKLVEKLADKNFAGVSADLRDNILRYYETRTPPGVVAVESALAMFSAMTRMRACWARSAEAAMDIAASVEVTVSAM